MVNGAGAVRARAQMHAEKTQFLSMASRGGLSTPSGWAWSRRIGRIRSGRRREAASRDWREINFARCHVAHPPILRKCPPTPIPMPRPAAGTIGVCWTRNQVSGVAGDTLVEHQWAELHTAVRTFHRSKQDYAARDLGDMMPRACLFTEASHEQVDAMMTRLGARWGDGNEGHGSRTELDGNSLFNDVLPASDAEAYLLQAAKRTGAAGHVRTLLSTLGAVEFRKTLLHSNLAAKLLSRLGRILHIARAPYESTLFLDDDVAFCPSAAPLVSEALAAAARADGLRFKPDVRMVEGYLWAQRLNYTWNLGCERGDVYNVSDVARAGRRDELVRTCLNSMPASTTCRIGEPREQLRQGSRAMLTRGRASMSPIDWCKESGWTDRGCAACAVECGDRVDAAGAGYAEHVACAPFSALGGSSVRKNGCRSGAKLGVNGGAIYVRFGRGARTFSRDWARAYVRTWVGKRRMKKLGNVSRGWAKDQGPLSTLVVKACAAQAATNVSNEAPGWTIAPLWPGLNTRPRSKGGMPLGGPPPLVVHLHGLVAADPKERETLFRRIDMLCSADRPAVVQLAGKYEIS